MILAITIAILGLVGLSVFLTERRTKEIGIRKVNGAKVSEILTMLNKDFIKWVTIAFVIACPVTWYAMHKWLQSFAYKTDPELVGVCNSRSSGGGSGIAYGELAELAGGD